MSPSQFHAKREITTTTSTITESLNGLLPLKINKNSHFIKKSSSPPPSISSSSSSTSSSLVNSMVASNKPQQRQPVIIYTHSPRVIHTDPKDFMALVQKLTGLSGSEDDGGSNNNNSPPSQLKQEPGGGVARDREGDRKKAVMNRNEDNEASSVTTDENNCSSSIGENQVNSCLAEPPLPMMEPPLNPYMANFPMYVPNTAGFMCSSQPFFN